MREKYLSVKLIHKIGIFIQMLLDESKSCINRYHTNFLQYSSTIIHTKEIFYTNIHQIQNSKTIFLYLFPQVQVYLLKLKRLFFS